VPSAHLAVHVAKVTLGFTTPVEARRVGPQPRSELGNGHQFTRCLPYIHFRCIFSSPPSGAEAGKLYAVASDRGRDAARMLARGAEILTAGVNNY